MYYFNLIAIAMVETLALETVSWEKERGIEFTFDGVSTLMV